jgi:hypothetical protein
MEQYLHYGIGFLSSFWKKCAIISHGITHHYFEHQLLVPGIFAAIGPINVFSENEPSAVRYARDTTAEF